MEKFAIFCIQFSYALLRTLEEHFNDFLILCHFITSDPASPIYYVLKRKYYIKIHNFLKKLKNIEMLLLFYRFIALNFKHISQYAAREYYAHGRLFITLVLSYPHRENLNHRVHAFFQSRNRLIKNKLV